MKPYPNREALANPRKAEFNSRLSRIRTRYTENIFGIMKRKYSILKTLRAHYDCARRIIIAIAILHNISIRWRQEDIDIDDEPAPVPPFPRVPIIEDAAAPDVVHERGQIVRDQLLHGMKNRRRH